MMQQSLEIRWFFKSEDGRKPVLDWFRTIEGNMDNPEAERTDFYLNHFFKGTLGIKLRAGDLEIKEKVTAGIKQEYWNKLGAVEIYNKSEFNAAEEGTVPLNLGQDKKRNRWIAVQKKRKLIKIDTGHSLKIYPGDKRIDDGCSVEITKLQLNGHHWWTFCIEAYGKDMNIQQNLNEVLRYIETTFKKIKQIVKPELSMGYPYWLYSNNHPKK